MTQARGVIDGSSRRGPFWAWLLVCLAMTAVMVYVRFWVYPDRIVPLAYGLPLLVCLINRDLRLLWGMTAVFVILVLHKMFVLVPVDELMRGTRITFAAMQIGNTVIVAGVIHAVIRLTGRLEEAVAALEQTNAELEASNEELAAREEEITQQNEELQSQAEELEQQMEELNTQAEELQSLNEALAARERSLDELLEAAAGGAGESETLSRVGEMVDRLLGHRACGAAVLEPAREGRLAVRPLYGVETPRTSPRATETLAALASARGRAAFLPDMAMRPDLHAPMLSAGAPASSVLSAPLRTGGIEGAVLEVYSAMPGGWSEQDLRLAQWIADQTGRLWSNARLREALSHQRYLLRTVTENASAALVMTDGRGRCTYMNPAAERLTGHDFKNAEGRDLHDLLHGRNAGHAPAECPFRLAPAAEGEGKLVEETITTASGERVPIICSAVGAQGSGEHGTVVIELRDVRDERRAAVEREQLLDSERSARAEAERASRAKDEFVATLSHELRTPLNAILGWATLLTRDGLDAQEQGKGLEVIERNARLQSQLISDLLDISRITSGKIRLDVQRVDLPGVVEATLASIKPAADGKRIRVETLIEPADRVVMGDPSRLQQVVWNLLSNAIKFTPSGGVVRVVLSRVASYVQLTVSDTGEGIAPEMLPYIFERYRQADGSARRRHGGLGLGLAIVKHLVELHGGTVHARSDGPGKGASFSALLPVHAVDVDGAAAGVHPTSPSAASRGGAAPRLEGVSVLVVDDEPDARELVQRILEERGAQVRTAGTAEEAMEALKSSCPDVLISDIGMPVMDGYTLIRRVREWCGAHRLPAIALTAFARAEDRTRALLAGFQSHISKPVEPVELVAAIAALAPPKREQEA